MPAARFRVGGKVQGVFFRASAHEEALRLSLAGHARNLADGSVEVLARGELGALDELERWLRHGPPLARVESLTREELAEQPLHGFGIG